MYEDQLNTLRTGGCSPVRKSVFSLLHYFVVFNSSTLTEYGGNDRVKSEPSPETFAITGTILVGSVMELVSSGPLPLRVMVRPLGSTEETPVRAT